MKKSFNWGCLIIILFGIISPFVFYIGCSHIWNKYSPFKSDQSITITTSLPYTASESDSVYLVKHYYCDKCGKSDLILAFELDPNSDDFTINQSKSYCNNCKKLDIPIYIKYKTIPNKKQNGKKQRCTN